VLKMVGLIQTGIISLNSKWFDDIGSKVFGQGFDSPHLHQNVLHI
jgi:hypothetical protein